MGVTLNQLTNSVKKVKEYTEEALENKLKISDNFLTDNGFGKARCKSGDFEYYDETTSIWKKSNDAASRVIVNIAPKQMRKLVVRVSPDDNTFKLKWLEPEDTIINNELVSSTEKVVIVRKKDSAPTSPTDGDTVITIMRTEFGQYEDTWYIDKSCTPNIGETWYYKAFPYNTSGIYCDTYTNEIKCEYRDYELYGFSINQAESDTDSMVEYLENTDAYNCSPAKMNFTTSEFEYGDWDDTWFMKGCKPCMLKNDGTVDYYLNPNDYTKKENGEDSDATNSSYEGNVMVEFPKVYIKIDVVDDNNANIYVANKKIDDSYHCYAHIDSNGNEVDKIYLPAYGGCVVDDKLRSISGKGRAQKITIASCISKARANDPEDIAIYDIESFSDRQLLVLLLVLISKTINHRSAFGNGNIYYNSGSTYDCVLKTGTLDKKGLFYAGTSSKSQIKLFGMEALYGDQNRFINGLLADAGVQKVKLYRTVADDYNLTGDGYTDIGQIDCISSSAKYIDKMYLDYGIIPKSLSGSATTYYRSISNISAGSNIGVAVVGGSCYTGNAGGLFLLSYVLTTFNNWSTSAALVCKPLSKTNIGSE